MRTEDGCIIHKCLNGEPEAFGLLVDKYKAGIYAFVYAKLRDFRDAEDVTQEVFLQAYRDLRGLRRWESFVFWLYRIASTRCGKWIRTRSRRPDIEFIEDQDLKTLKDSSIDSYRENQMNESLQEALYSLREAYREVLTLYYFGGMNSLDIAKALGTSPTAIRKRLSRARIQLKEEMAGMMGTAFEGQKLQAAFTFRIVEAVKQVKIHPMPRAMALPWGLSLAAGIILTVMSLNPHLSILNPASFPMGSPLPSEAKVLKTGEIPVDVLKISNIMHISDRRGNGKGGEPEFPDLQSALFMAPQGRADTWTRRADMPTARGRLSANTVNGKIYAIGGATWWQELSTVEEYDPAKDTWTKKADMPTQRCLLTTSVVKGKIYAIGGDVVAIVEEYDPVTDKWTKKADMPTGRSFHSASVVNGKIYVIGGHDGTRQFSAVEEYDPETDTWTKKADMPTARAALSASAVNGKIYAIGGAIGLSLTSVVEEYDPVTDKWTRKADMPTARRSLSTDEVGGKIYAIGGSIARDAADFDPCSAVEEYDPATDTWAKRTNMPTPRGEGFASSVVNGRIYIIGGFGFFGPLTSVEEYDTGFAGEKVERTGKLPTTWGEVKM